MKENKIAQDINRAVDYLRGKSVQELPRLIAGVVDKELRSAIVKKLVELNQKKLVFPQSNFSPATQGDQSLKEAVDALDKEIKNTALQNHLDSYQNRMNSLSTEMVDSSTVLGSPSGLLSVEEKRREIKRLINAYSGSANQDHRASLAELESALDKSIDKLWHKWLSLSAKASYEDGGKQDFILCKTIRDIVSLYLESRREVLDKVGEVFKQKLVRLAALDYAYVEAIKNCELKVEEHRDDTHALAEVHRSVLGFYQAVAIEKANQGILPYDPADEEVLREDFENRADSFDRLFEQSSERERVAEQACNQMLSGSIRVINSVVAHSDELPPESKNEIQSFASKAIARIKNILNRAIIGVMGLFGRSQSREEDSPSPSPSPRARL